MYVYICIYIYTYISYRVYIYTMYDIYIYIYISIIQGKLGSVPISFIALVVFRDVRCYCFC